MVTSRDKRAASIYSVVGERIKKLRNENGMTQQDLAEKAGISVAFLSFLESGNRKGSLETYHRLAEALGSSFDLFGEALSGKSAYPHTNFPNLSVAEARAMSHFVKTLKKDKR